MLVIFSIFLEKKRQHFAIVRRDYLTNFCRKFKDYPENASGRRKSEKKLQELDLYYIWVRQKLDS